MKLFVYGTLKRGECNNDLLTAYGAKFIQEDKLLNHGVYGYAPIAGPAEGVTLEGEVWDNISEELWERLDALEWGYRRKEITTVGNHKAVLYIYGGILKLVGPTSLYKVFSKWPVFED